MIFAGFAVYALYYHFVARLPASEFGWRYIAWLLPWFGGLWVLSWLGGIKGGLGVLSFGTEIWVIALWSLIVLAIALATRMPPEDTQEMFRHILESNIQEASEGESTSGSGGSA